MTLPPSLISVTDLKKSYGNHLVWMASIYRSRLAKSWCSVAPLALANQR